MTMAAQDSPLKVGLIGFGAIGRSVAALLPASVALGVLTRSSPADLRVGAAGHTVDSVEHQMWVLAGSCLDGVEDRID